MKVIKLYKILKYKVQIIIGIAVIIACTLIYISYNMLFDNSNKKEENDEIKNNIKFSQNNFKLNSYYSNSKIKVFSNKNENEYNVEEKYKSINNTQCYILKFNNRKSGTSKYYINGDKIKIENDMQKNKYIVPNNYLECNLMSINTYMKLLNEAIINGLKYEDYSNDDRKDMKLYNIDLESIKNKEMDDVKKKLQKVDIIFDDNGLYKIYAFDKNGKLYVDIEINDFINDYSIDDYEFDF